MVSLEEYFGDWLKVFDRKEFNNVLSKVNTLYKKHLICPKQEDVFKAFKLCKYEDCKAVFIGQDPFSDIYEGEPRATGILFGNSKTVTESKLSPSLKIVKDSCIDLHIPHNCITFDQTLESWAKQGILMINSALTVETYKAGSHTMLWRPFISSMLHNMSQINTGIIYVLFGSIAYTFKPYIGKFNDIIVEKHPAYYARMHEDMPSDVFYKVNELLKGKYGTTIKWYDEFK